MGRACQVLDAGRPRVSPGPTRAWWVCPGGLSPVADRDWHVGSCVGAVAEQEVLVVAPAAGGAVGHDRTSVGAAGGDAGYPAEGCGGVGGVKDRDWHR